MISFYKITAQPSNTNYYLYHENLPEDFDFQTIVNELFQKHVKQIDNKGKRWSTWVIIDEVVTDLQENYKFKIIDDYFLPHNHIVFTNEDILEILKD